MMENDRILLRPWLESDAEVLFKYASDPEVGPRAGWPPHKSVEESREIIRTVFCDATNTWAIELKETGEPIGAMGYGPSCQCNLPAREGEPLIGYWVGRPYWNQGICTEALGLMIEHIRKTTDIQSLISGHFIDNPASGRVMEKCGFVPTGETVVDLDQGRDTPIRVLRLELGTPQKVARIQQAVEKNKQGTHNCAQAILCTYCDICGLDPKTAEDIAGAFGLGMGNMEGTCGSLVGAGMVVGLVSKDRHLARKRMKQVMGRFKERNGATQCRLLKGVDTGVVLRDCPDCIADAAEFLEDSLSAAGLMER